MDLSSLMVTVLIAFLMLPSTSLAGSLPSKYGPRYVEVKCNLFKARKFIIFLTLYMRAPLHFFTGEELGPLADI